MKRRLLFPALAGIGALAMLAAILATAWPNHAHPPPAPALPYADSVSATGTVEAEGGNVSVAAPVAGIVTAVNVRPGEQVGAQAVLVRLDARDLTSQRPLAVAAIGEALEREAQAKQLYQIALNVPDQRAVSKEELAVRAGAVKLAAAVLASARARLTQLTLEQERRLIRAPASGMIVQVNVRPGEATSALAPGRAPILMAANGPRLVRVDVDEFEASRLRPGAPALASPRGHPSIRLALIFERIEPLIVAKTNLAGTATERVDTRVLQVIYRLGANAPLTYIGQQMDVTIAAAPGPVR